MKKTILYLMISVVTLSTFSTPLWAAEKNQITTAVPPREIPPEVQLQLNRIDEIKAMDKTDLTRAEKKELRKEVRAIRADIRANNNGIYLSVGGAIIIILLLILLL
jgi:hypothetical protein